MQMKPTLPDPTADLHWSDYAGAIQDIFAKNATTHPDRLFVVETPSSTVPQREFTYWQIHQASNVIAHHLLGNGIGRGDVVMIYAYRGVDLVVAVLGTLKAGAAFSVVDPGYPPDRQKIYLEVAQPRALIVIAKASRDEGALSEQVQAYIQEKLHLRTTIPDLELLDDGSIRGGIPQKEGIDVLEEHQSLTDTHPGVVVGPDTQPTLSFTSGSEGIVVLQVRPIADFWTSPKDVKEGITRKRVMYCAFMRDRFQMSEHDNFTMLSGIAHDPIQRDMFTPMFLGAKLLVPSKEDIQHESLAEWMKKHQASVTHLTPAMGQILVGGASTEFPSLKNAFVGMRAYGSLGTTETQRAVSFYEIPSRMVDAHYLSNMGDVIPAGKGMKDVGELLYWYIQIPNVVLQVQLLVVNRDSLIKGHPRLCSVRESGELFVRAGGLAEGYLGSDKDEQIMSLNKEKFIPNFFTKNEIWEEQDKRRLQERGSDELWRRYWRGPRDRLYRTGDLGHYMMSSVDGDVHVACTGRADSQVKIRGFRVELGEIDTHLSHHPLVRENVTLVRRNKDEEQTLVSYIVPELREWPNWLAERGLPDDTDDDTMVGMLKRFRALTGDVRITLRSKLPNYAIPDPIIPLRKMPLTPNAKIDKRALPYPDAAEWAEVATAGKAARSDFSPTEKYIGEIWAQRIPGISAEIVDLDDRFFDIGGQSMVGQGVLFDIKKGKGVPLSMNTLFQNPTLREFAAVLEASLNLTNGEQFDSTPPEMDYHLDGELMNAKAHEQSIPSTQSPPKSFLVTGCTGYLGAHILADLLSRRPDVKIFAHVRASSSGDVLRRIKETCEAYGVWNEKWFDDQRIEPVIGDLSEPNLGIEGVVWNRLADNVDCIIHNGARVHWVHSYTYLKAANVNSTLSCINLCTTGRPKSLTFVSSTAVLDTSSYDTASVKESDDLSRSRKGLPNGYGQTKYVSEYLIREAGKRGLRCSIVRPGYITGDPGNGIGPLDDFLLRMLKGSIQLGCAPDLASNTINLVPVSHCARIVAAASLHPPSLASSGVDVLQVTPHPQLRWNTFLGALQAYGYDAPILPYAEWRIKLESYVASNTSNTTTADETGNPTTVTTVESNDTPKEPHALLPLFNWVTDDLPRDTVSRALDDTNAERILRADDPEYDFEKESQVTEETVGRYLAFMASVGFIEAPLGGGNGKVLPTVGITEAQKKALERVGRGGK
ncbi:large subunit of alpha-aminoadipate reductase [Lecanora helva]